MQACFSSKQKQRACFLKFKRFLFHNLENCGNLSSDISCCLTSLKTSLQKSFSSEWNQSQIFKYILNFLKEKFFRRLKNRFLLLKRSDMRNWFYDRMDLSCQIAANWVHSGHKSNHREKVLTVERSDSELWQNLVIWIMFQ